MKLLKLLFAALFFSMSALAQTGQVEGKLTDSKSGTQLSGVSVQVEGLNKTVTTGTDGRFTLSLPAGKKYTLKISSVGYQAKLVEDVEVLPNQTTNLDVVLDRGAKTVDEVVVRTSARKETAAALIAYQKNTSVVAQVVSAEAIKRSPDKNTGEVLKRVPGASVQDGKYLVVRGLADRYNQAMLNGVLMNSTEPDRKTFSFDIIPAPMVDNIIINKAFIPELPGEWAGGLIQVNTKDVPSKNFFNIQVGTGLNTETISNEFYSYKGGGTDWLGFDDGTRALPASFLNKSGFAALPAQEKANLGASLNNEWTTAKDNRLKLNQGFQLNGGFNSKLSSKTKLAGIFALNYLRHNKRLEYQNQINSFENHVASLSFDYLNTKYSEEILAGALANLTLQIGNNHKISFKNILNVNSTDYATERKGLDFDNQVNPNGTGDKIRANELAFKANTFFNTQLSGDHNINKYDMKFHWFGSFNILDQYVPDQRRLQYNQNVTLPGQPFLASFAEIAEERVILRIHLDDAFDDTGEQRKIAADVWLDVRRGDFGAEEEAP